MPILKIQAKRAKEANCVELMLEARMGIMFRQAAAMNLWFDARGAHLRLDRVINSRAWKSKITQLARADKDMRALIAKHDTAAAKQGLPPMQHYMSSILE